jgi:ankyrin repeat protein
LHFACEQGLYNLVRLLLEKRANSNVQTRQTNFDNSLSSEVYLQTAMHRAVLSNNESILDLFIDFNGHNEPPNYNLKDSRGQTVLSLCIWNNMFDTATKLISIMI